MKKIELTTAPPEPKRQILGQFLESLTGIMKKKTTRYVNIAAMFKYLGEYAFLFFMPAYFQAVYPTMKVEFASANALSLSVLGFISAVMGGIISDKFG
jgi:nitrate/nitrite transporter NarK